MIDDPSTADRRDNLRARSAPADLNNVEISVKKMGHIGSMNSCVMSWIFQLAYLPVGLWGSGEEDRFLENSFRAAFASLAKHPDPEGLLRATYVDHEDKDGWGDAGDTDYYLFTNIMHDTGEAEVARLVSRAQAMFVDALPRLEAPRFGIATPQSMVDNSPEAIERFVIGLLREPSGYQLIARDGRITVSPFTEHGAFASARLGGGPSLVTASSTLWAPDWIADATVSDFETLLNDPRVLERHIQRFLEENPRLLRGIDGRYCEARAHVGLVDADGERLVPDFMARIEGRDVWDVIELKLPKHPMLVNRGGRKTASAHATRAIMQLLQYRDHFARPDNRARLATTFPIAPFEPCMVVVIGRGSPDRRNRWRSSSLGIPDVTLVSYDYLLQRARACSQLLL